ncbi:MAG: DUF2460 domain-containing protein [Rickettsiales bacterium]|jgi:uncharacterized protein (TIGR02217 family)|nr:DUF2460 domain-containing protein [Rickettsiales bacterium]
MFYELNFPDSVAFKCVNSLYFDTNVVRSQSGFEQRSGNREYPLSSFKISSILRNRQEIEQILALFRIARGKLNGFRFRDWLDYKVDNQIIGVGDGESASFQIKKTYQIGNYFVERKIVKPVQNTVNVFLDQINCNDALQSVDYAQGLVNFSQPPAENKLITISCEFDTPVRFRGDVLGVVLADKNSYEIDDLELTEIRL